MAIDIDNNMKAYIVNTHHVSYKKDDVTNAAAAWTKLADYAKDVRVSGAGDAVVKIDYTLASANIRKYAAPQWSLMATATAAQIAVGRERAWMLKDVAASHADSGEVFKYDSTNNSWVKID